MFKLSIETRLACLYGFETKQDVTSSLLASRIGRVASVLAELFCIGRVYHSYDSNRFCHKHTVLLTLNMVEWWKSYCNHVFFKVSKKLVGAQNL